MNKLNLFSYVLYDKANDHVAQYEDNGKVMMFDTIEKAEKECYGNEEVVMFHQLPFHWKVAIQNQ